MLQALCVQELSIMAYLKDLLRINSSRLIQQFPS